MHTQTMCVMVIASLAVCGSCVAQHPDTVGAIRPTYQDAPVDPPRVGTTADGQFHVFTFGPIAEIPPCHGAALSGEILGPFSECRPTVTEYCFTCHQR